MQCFVVSKRRCPENINYLFIRNSGRQAIHKTYRTHRRNICNSISYCSTFAINLWCGAAFPATMGLSIIYIYDLRRFVGANILELSQFSTELLQRKCNNFSFSVSLPKCASETMRVYFVLIAFTEFTIEIEIDGVLANSFENNEKINRNFESNQQPSNSKMQTKQRSRLSAVTINRLLHFHHISFSITFTHPHTTYSRIQLANSFYIFCQRQQQMAILCPPFPPYGLLICCCRLVLSL